MSDRSFRRRGPATNRKSRLPKPTLSFRRRAPTPRISKTPKSIKILQRCHSEPILYTFRLFLGDKNDDYEAQIPKPDAFLFRRHQTCMDVFTSPFGSPIPSPSPRSADVYSKDAKVVVTVTVEGSPGPLRTMVKLGSSVEDTIKVVVDKYRDERRTPHLDRDAASSFQLHHSYFSLDSLDKAQTIGEAGNRSFYLRTSSFSRESSFNSDGGGVASSNTDVMAQVVSVKAKTATPAIASLPLIIFSQDFIARKIHKIVRRTCKLWKLMGCVYCE
ncbi:uncharacterized protein At4g22758-like [Macadamia integrifolia]|uniref:uncharacterized protein At4g22758-like n=1 Tax=Macadamia integrifolia TaxID=60698 RepID=UPI001C4E9D99|nr:uncharacterized protein At4g22758-like [Macadamia integrifolia]